MMEEIENWDSLFRFIFRFVVKASYMWFENYLAKNKKRKKKRRKS